jgi:uncharacterized ubiquitin-like protein YukD
MLTSIPTLEGARRRKMITGYSKTITDLALSNYLAEKKETFSSDSMDATFRNVAICQIRTFAFAGHDTTSSTICYAFHLTEGSYAYKVGNYEIRISEYRFAKVLICLVQNVLKLKVLRQIAFHYSHQKINIYFNSKE